MLNTCHKEHISTKTKIMKIYHNVGSFLLLISGVTINSKVSSQDLYHSLPIKIQKGTLIIAAIGSDGILIAADSRVTNAIAIRGTIRAESFRDSCQKIFIANGLPVANTGYYSIGKQPFFKFVEEYNKNSLL